MIYAVYEVHKDGKSYYRYSSSDRFECEVYVAHHRYDNSIMRSNARLVIVSE